MTVLLLFGIFLQKVDDRLEIVGVEAVKDIFEVIHSESIRQQLTVMNGNEV